MTLEQERREMFPAFIVALDAIDSGADVVPFKEEYPNTLLDSYRKGVSRRQAIICYTKWMHRFNVKDVFRDLGYLQGELNEAKKAWESEGTEDFAKELADVAIYCYGIAQMIGADLDTVIEDKMKFNIQRSYQKEGFD